MGCQGHHPRLCLPSALQASLPLLRGPTPLPSRIFSTSVPPPHRVTRLLTQLSRRDPRQPPQVTQTPPASFLHGSETWGHESWREMGNCLSPSQNPPRGRCGTSGHGSGPRKGSRWRKSLGLRPRRPWGSLWVPSWEQTVAGSARWGLEGVFTDIVAQAPR